MPSAGSNRRRVALDGRIETTSARPAASLIRRRPKSFASLVVVAVAVVAVVTTGISSANPCKPLIEAGADCNGVVSFTAKAEDGPDFTADDRTNDDVAVQYSTGGAQGPWETVTSKHGKKYAYDESNGYSFSDSFDLPDSVQRPAHVTLRAVTKGSWGAAGNGGKDQRSSSTSIRVPESCDDTPPTPKPAAGPSAKVTGPTCASASAKVMLTNPSDESVSFTISRADSETPLMTVPVQSGTVTKWVKVDAETTLTIAADGMDDITKDLAPASDCEQPVVASAAVTKICKADASGWNVTFDNSANHAEGTFVVKSGETVLDTVKVPAKAQLTNSYGFGDAGVASGSSIPLTVSVDGKTVATQSVANDCVQTTADVKAACDTAAGAGAVLSFTNTGQVADTVTVARDGKAVDGSPFTLAPSQTTTQKLLRLNEDESTTITIMTASGLNVQKDVKLDCVQTSSVAEVKGDVVNRPQLAETGVALLPLSLFAALMSLTGFGLLRMRSWI